MKTKIKYPILGFAPGHYISKCTECEEPFMGDKRAVQCEPCAINMLNDLYSKSHSKIRRLEVLFDKMINVRNMINSIESEEKEIK